MRTIKQMADELGISKITAYRWIKNNNIIEAEQIAQTKWYDEIVFDRMKEYFETHSNGTGETQQSASNHYNETDNETLKWYREQLAAKDKQIEELHQLLNQSHQIQGALLAENTKLHALVESSQNAPEAPTSHLDEKEEEVPIQEEEAVQALTEPLESSVNEQGGAEPPQAKRSLLEKLRAAFNEFKKD